MYAIVSWKSEAATYRETVVTHNVQQHKERNAFRFRSWWHP